MSHAAFDVTKRTMKIATAARRIHCAYECCFARQFNYFAVQMTTFRTRGLQARDEPLTLMFRTLATCGSLAADSRASKTATRATDRKCRCGGVRRGQANVAGQQRLR